MEDAPPDAQWNQILWFTAVDGAAFLSDPTAVGIGVHQLLWDCTDTKDVPDASYVMVAVVNRTRSDLVLETVVDGIHDSVVDGTKGQVLAPPPADLGPGAFSVGVCMAGQPVELTDPTCVVGLKASAATGNKRVFVGGGINRPFNPLAWAQPTTEYTCSVEQGFAGTAIDFWKEYVSRSDGKDYTVTYSVRGQASANVYGLHRHSVVVVADIQPLT